MAASWYFCSTIDTIVSSFCLQCLLTASTRTQEHVIGNQILLDRPVRVLFPGDQRASDSNTDTNCISWMTCTTTRILPTVVALGCHFLQSLFPQGQNGKLQPDHFWSSSAFVVAMIVKKVFLGNGGGGVRLGTNSCGRYEAV